jgi:hypothetical protein
METHTLVEAQPLILVVPHLLEEANMVSLELNIQELKFQEHIILVKLEARFLVVAYQSFKNSLQI